MTAHEHAVMASALLEMVGEKAAKVAQQLDIPDIRKAALPIATLAQAHAQTALALNDTERLAEDKAARAARCDCPQHGWIHPGDSVMDEEGNRGTVLSIEADYTVTVEQTAIQRYRLNEIRVIA